jgi:methionine-rich copper-binding protein CopC
VVASALAVSPARAQIALTEAQPPDGAQLDAPPELVRLCFSQPVSIEDGTAFKFDYQTPDGRSLGSRIVFELSGECVDVFPGLPDEPPAGEYRFEWQVTAAQGDEESSGTLQFQVTPGGTPAGAAGDDEGPDILFLALITTASAGGAALLFTLGYLLRRRIGYEPHRPPEGGAEGDGH